MLLLSSRNILSRVFSYQDGLKRDEILNNPDCALKCGHFNLLDQDIPFLPTVQSYSTVMETKSAPESIDYLIKNRIYAPCLVGDEAAKAGRLDILEELMKASKCPCSFKSVLLAAAAGHNNVLDLLQRLFHIGYIAALPQAAENGHLHTVEWLYKHGYVLEALDEEIALCASIKNQHRSITQYIFANCGTVGTNGTRAADLAAAHGDLPLLKQLLARPRKGTDQRISNFAIDKAAKNGTPMALTLAASHGHVAVVEYLSHQRPFEAVESNLLDVVAAHGQLEVLKYILLQLPQPVLPPQAITTDIHAAPTFIAQQTHLFDQLQLTTDAMDGAAAGGYLEMVQYLHNVLSMQCTTDAMDMSATNGHLEVVKWLHIHRQEGCTVKAMDGASENGHLDICKYLHTHRREGCERALDLAAQQGHLHIVKWLHEHTSVAGDDADIASSSPTNPHTQAPEDADIGPNATPTIWGQLATTTTPSVLPLNNMFMNINCTGFAFEWSAGNGHLEVFKFLCEHYEPNYNTSAVELAARGGHLNTLVHMHSLAPELFRPQFVGYETMVDHQFADTESEAMNLASRHGHCNVVNWLQKGVGLEPDDRACDWAARNGHLSMLIHILHTSNAKPTAKALDWAILNHHIDVMFYLIEHGHGTVYLALAHSKRYGHISLTRALEGGYIGGFRVDHGAHGVVHVTGASPTSSPPHRRTISTSF